MTIKYIPKAIRKLTTFNWSFILMILVFGVVLNSCTSYKAVTTYTPFELIQLRPEHYIVHKDLSSEATVTTILGFINIPKVKRGQINLQNVIYRGKEGRKSKIDEKIDKGQVLAIYNLVKKYPKLDYIVDPSFQKKVTYTFFTVKNTVKVNADGIQIKSDDYKLPDKDKDGVPDINDLCPDKPGVVELAGCPDKDKDGVTDKDDECPELFGLELYNGCPDTDHDGIIDPNDDCPADSGLAKYRGCPDSDSDGIINSKDACPDAAGLSKNKGCPDSDSDGIIDKNDECPLVPGPSKNNGCPEEEMVKIDISAKEKKEKEILGKKVELEKKEEDIVNTLFKSLEFESGTAEIKNISYPSIDKLYELLSSKEKYKVYIAGHTDNIGTDLKNIKLGLARAEAVKTYLIKKGIKTQRIITESFGEGKPLDPNTTEEGRARNRRVEFYIVL